jgi:hypothetical protein
MPDLEAVLVPRVNTQWAIRTHPRGTAGRKTDRNSNLHTHTRTRLEKPHGSAGMDTRVTRVRGTATVTCRKYINRAL